MINFVMAWEGRGWHLCHVSAIPHLEKPLVFFQCADNSLKSLITQHHEGSLKELSSRGFPLPFPSCFLDG